MAVSVENYGALKTRIEGNTGRKGSKFDELFPQWLNEVIRDIEQVYPLSYTFSGDVEVALTAQIVSISKLITQHPFSVRTYDNKGLITNELVKLDKVEANPATYQEIDFGVPGHFSVHYDAANPEDVRLKVYPPSDDSTRKIAISGYFYTTNAAWVDSDINYLIARYPKLVRYGIQKLLYEYDKDYAQVAINEKNYETLLYGRPEAETEGLIQQEKRSNERGIVRTMRTPTDFEGREGPTGIEYQTGFDGVGEYLRYYNPGAIANDQQGQANQVPSDFQVTTESSFAFIKNKPSSDRYVAQSSTGENGQILEHGSGTPAWKWLRLPIWSNQNGYEAWSLVVYLSKLYISNKAIAAPNQGENNQTPGQAVDDWKSFSSGASTGGILEVTDPNFPTIPIAKGGTGSSSAGTARTALGITAVLVRGFLASLSGTNRLSASAIKDLTGQISSATTIAPGLMSYQDKVKINAIETEATKDLTATEIVTLIGALTGNARLDVSAIKNLVSSGAATGPEIKALLETLVNDARLDASAIKNLDLAAQISPSRFGFIASRVRSVVSLGLAENQVLQDVSLKGTSAFVLSSNDSLTDADANKITVVDDMGVATQISIGKPTGQTNVIARSALSLEAHILVGWVNPANGNSYLTRHVAAGGASTHVSHSNLGDPINFLAPHPDDDKILECRYNTVDSEFRVRIVTLSAGGGITVGAGYAVLADLVSPVSATIRGDKLLVLENRGKVRAYSIAGFGRSSEDDEFYSGLGFRGFASHSEHIEFIVSASVFYRFDRVVNVHIPPPTIVAWGKGQAAAIASTRTSTRAAAHGGESSTQSLLWNTLITETWFGGKAAWWTEVAGTAAKGGGADIKPNSSFPDHCFFSLPAGTYDFEALIGTTKTSEAYGEIRLLRVISSADDELLGNSTLFKSDGGSKPDQAGTPDLVSTYYVKSKPFNIISSDILYLINTETVIESFSQYLVIRKLA